MTDPATCELVRTDLWDRDYLDLIAPAYLRIGTDGRAEFAFGAIEATAECEYSRTTIFFRWAGFDEGDEIAGNGLAELQHDGRLEIELFFDNGDDAILTACRE